MTAKLITAFILPVLFVTLFGRFYIPWLRKQKAGQEIKSEVTQHSAKAGTPTLGGLMIILGVALSMLTVGFEGLLSGKWIHFVIFGFALIFGAIGFLDDWEKLRHKQNLGLTAKTKFLLQLLASIVLVFALEKLGYIKCDIYVPFFNKYIYPPVWLYYLFAAFVIVGTVNAVNITDGLDGLCTGTSIPVFLFYSAVAFICGKEYLELGVFSSAMIGALVGFLFYNFYPAKVFMGDTGSLFIGGAVAAMAFAYDMPLILVTLGIIYIIETLSDLIQISYFKATHGKRVFRMAPFHHHLELGAWSGHKYTEKEVFALFTGISLVFAVISLIGVYQKLI